ncbi:MAG: GntR family transcriptional regulator [Acidobacteria bacterium]|nr:GntR family transcriptional regulator [Acidobacteriota bacterium]
MSTGPSRAPGRVPRDGAAGARIAEELRLRILHGDLRPGDRIRQETLAVRHGASRAPVREALRILQADGLVVTVANTGAWVARLSQAECEEIYQVRERLEPLLLRMSLPQLGPARIERLATLAREIEQVDDVEQFLRLDRALHLLSYEGAETAMLGDTIERLWNTTQHYRRAFSLLIEPEDRRTLHDEHHMLVKAIRDGDAEDAERVLAGHIRRTRLQLAHHPAVFA